METNLVHGPGDKYGQPFRLDAYQRQFIWRAYELKPDGTRRYTRAVLGVAKGNAKTELAAAIACAELGGPVIFDRWHPRSQQPIGKRRVSPDIPVAAASFDQADLLFGCARVMIKEGRLAEFFEVFDTEILIKGTAGIMYRVAAVAGTNDGKRPTFFPADELHEWTGNKERVHLVLSNGRAKRADSWELSISTAGWDIASLLGRKYLHGKRVLAGEAKDDALLFVWYEPLSKDVDLTDLPALRQAILEANPASFVNVDAVIARAAEIPEFEFRRYHLNQWVDSPERWLPYGAWESCVDAARGLPPDGAEIVLALDGTYDGTSTALVGATCEAKPHVFVVDSWEQGQREDWKIALPEAEDAVRRACGRWSVRTLGMDPNRWRTTIARLEGEGLPVVEWQTHLATRMVPACAQFYDAAAQQRMTQDGNEQLAQHIANAVVKVDSRGPRIAKEHKDSARRIDLAVAAVAALDLALRESNAGTWDFSTFDLGK